LWVLLKEEIARLSGEVGFRRGGEVISENHFSNKASSQDGRPPGKSVVWITYGLAVFMMFRCGEVGGRGFLKRKEKRNQENN